MTFEEFFVKKKIDLKALQAADEPLYEEFRMHYAVMGEKSFDHSKKFWFNKLRLRFHLEEEAAPVGPIANKADKAVPDPQTEALTAKPSGFKPRFKAAVSTDKSSSEAAATAAVQSDETTTENSKPTGFKPLFKAGATKSESVSSEPISPATDDTTAETSKPTGFKPRFKAGVTKTENTDTALGNTSTTQETSEAASAAASKPAGFKPRFKAGITKSESVPSEPVSPATDDTTAETSKPTGFKPRFKAGVTKTESADTALDFSATDGDVIANTSDKKTDTIDEQHQSIDPSLEKQNVMEAPEATTSNKPTGFKPRFKAGLTKIDKKEE
ncbi:hypothetical protein K7A41_14780 [Sphingobacterium sp. InxBP1]|uniref:hypothetical protein n=1 Tax=Sphingobacterium sp. InxBP1 TaxID=2870328 RepID=UPI0022444942|nr:hypothetical protein [Sphingobacterium sp. InxBP1]MCW8312495.1 hypothetical protein [Sphingobacterium sp. InxBP1]